MVMCTSRTCTKQILNQKSKSGSAPFDVCVLIFLAAAIFLQQVCMESVLRYTEDVGLVFTNENSSLLTLKRGRWMRVLCDNSNLHKQKLVKPKPLAGKMAAVKTQKNGEVRLLVEYLFCGRTIQMHLEHIANASQTAIFFLLIPLSFPEEQLPQSRHDTPLIPLRNVKHN